MSLKRKIVVSVGWVALLRYSSRFIDLFKYFLLTRILTQSDIGTFVLTTTLVITFEALSDTGLQYAFIQKQTNIRLYAKTLWVISILRGVVLGCIIFLTAGIFSSFFNSPSLYLLLLLISLVPIIKGFQSPYTLLFQKNLTFHKEFVFRFLPVVITSITSIILAFIFRNTTVLVIAIIIGNIAEVFASFVVTKTTFPYPFSIKRAIRLFHYGKYLTFGGIFTLLMTQADSLFVGRVFGTSSLAIYELAFKLANVAFSEVTDVISRVSFPVFSKFQKNKSQLLTMFQINTLVVSIPAIVALIVFLVFPSFVLTTAFGDAYKSGAIILQILAFYGLLRAIVGPTGPLFLAVGKPIVLTIMNILNFVLLIVLLFPFSQSFGLSGVALSMTISYLLVQPYLFYQLHLLYRNTKVS